MLVNIKVTGGLNIESGQIDPKATGGLNIESGQNDPKATQGLNKSYFSVKMTRGCGLQQERLSLIYTAGIV